MSEFILQPYVYATGTNHNLLTLLEDVWMRKCVPGSGTMYLLSGFANYNGGVRFFSTFKRHVDSGGRVISFFGGSTSQRLTSRQLVERMLGCGCEVNIINRKRIFHSKCYGTADDQNQNLVITSGNFTGTGMSQNVESTAFLDSDITSTMNFEWPKLTQSILAQRWETYQPSLADRNSPVWGLLFDEYEKRISLQESQFVTMVLILGHADTVRINAAKGTAAAKGSQYFWLSRDCYDFFPPLTILNERGYKTTNSCLINLHYVDLGIVQTKTRITFEAGNNVDFRLGTGRYRYTRLADEGDIATISRLSETDYEIRIVHQGTREYSVLSPYTTTFIGHQGKRIGYLANERFESLVNVSLPSREQFRRLKTE